MTTPFRRKWFQFSLKSLMAVVVVICLGLGGWHLLMTYGQYVEAEEPAIVGQPIKVRCRFFDFGSGEWVGFYKISMDKVLGFGKERSWTGFADDIGWWRYDVQFTINPVDEPSEYTLTLTTDDGRQIHGKFAVRPAK